MVLYCSLLYKSSRQVSRCVMASVFLYLQFSELPIWPSRDLVDKNMPIVFKDKYPSTRCIIACTELKCEVSKDYSIPSELWSEYKSHDTFKGLVGIDSSVSVSFISNLFGESTTDRVITEKYGILDLLEPNDSLMADKGFELRDMLINRGVTLNTPLKCQPGQNQMKSSDVFETQKIASV